jgi:hypothetical protein
MVELEEDERCGDDLPYPPRVHADVAQRLERHLQQRVPAFADRADAVVGLVELLLHLREVATLAGVPQLKNDNCWGYLMLCG